ncbi:DUF4189 domain-containing protein [Xanthomonas campestris]|jgi:hypothetical protein|uniref:DUF4189 domain-containing protein n=1 Tax=Xanthomonas campestris TaxID=339 RepID=UPI000E32B140|nr:DUF4189 domain-containing protein [Xanthomonas campestris]MEA9573513.1 DUF4189 domain-containing protein [Xanthomonas campestris]MEB2110198.1 DUF4189 domain-containing protein [Xanthomonas campestris pv. campestris]RFF77331.1 DUF4189 domain-containing protein [Xanthomonas campestris pv. campestris]
MKLSKILLLLLLNITFSAGAEQGCPPGQFPIGGQGAVACAPIPQTGSGPQEASPLGKWIKTWGAISLDKSSAGALGVSFGKRSKREAQQDAIAGCIKAGGKDCRDWTTYQNQCAAVAEPYRDGRSVAGTLHFRTGPSPEKIKREAEEICSSENKGECRVIYEACSEPIFKPY